MVSTSTPPVTIPEENRIAQLIPLKSCVPSTDPRVQGDQGFRSTGESQVFWTQIVGEQKSNVVCIVMMPQAKPPQIKVSGMIDIGADVTIISTHTWPPWCPTEPMGSTVAGLEGTTELFEHQTCSDKKSQGTNSYWTTHHCSTT